jgi:hypothetical protein
MSDPSTTHVPPQVCPSCGYLFTALGSAHDPDDRQIEAGDVTVCLNCAQPMIFVDSTTQRGLTPEEEAGLRGDDPDWSDVRLAQAKIRLMQASGMRTAQAGRGKGRMN